MLARFGHASSINDSVLARRFKVRGGLFALSQRSPGQPDGAQDDALPFADELQPAHPVKIQIAGQTKSALIVVYENRNCSHHYLSYPESPGRMPYWQPCSSCCNAANRKNSPPKPNIYDGLKLKNSSYAVSY